LKVTDKNGKTIEIPVEEGAVDSAAFAELGVAILDNG
jgi:hypothetical protein